MWIPGEWDKGREGGGAGVSRWIPGEWDKEGWQEFLGGYPGYGTRGGRGVACGYPGYGTRGVWGGRWIPGEWDKGGGEGVAGWIPGEWDKGGGGGMWIPG